MFDHDFEQEKHYHPENFMTERGEQMEAPEEPDFDILHDLNAELDNELPTKEEVLIKLADEEEKERKMTERMDRIEDQKFRWGEPAQQK